MAHYNFKRDLDASQEAVDAILDHLIEQGHVAHELEGKKEQAFGDIRVVNSDGSNHDIEVKFDLYAKKSGNLCFEMSNGKKMTGIMATKAKEVYYVVPNCTGKDVFVFNASKLKTYIQKPENVIIKKGGDKKKFILALVPIEKVVSDKLPESRFKLEAADA